MSEAVAKGLTVSEWVWVEKRLGRPGLLEGNTDQAVRVARLRAHLIAHDLGSVELGRRGGAPESWAQFFERQFGQPLGDAPDA